MCDLLVYSECSSSGGRFSVRVRVSCSVRAMGRIAFRLEYVSSSDVRMGA